MYVVCDSILPLSSAYYYRGSYCEAIFSFLKKFPQVRSVVVFRDLAGRGNPKDLQFISLLTSKQLFKLLSHCGSAAR